MKIADLIDKLQDIRESHGNLEVTVTAASLPDGYSSTGFEKLPDIFESTCENLLIVDKPVGNLTEKRVRLYF